MKTLEDFKFDLTFLLSPRPSLRAPLTRLFDGEATESDKVTLWDEAEFMLMTYSDPNHPNHPPLKALASALKKS